MSATKHTPGPWSADEYVSPPHTWFIRGPNLEKIVSGPQPPLTAANACLIAAAPELLDALAVMLKAYDFGEQFTPNHPIAIARAAIAKATGAP